MGQDDANVGDAEGECIGHVWQLAGSTLAVGEGATSDYVCAWGCGAVMVVAPGQALPGTV